MNPSQLIKTKQQINKKVSDIVYIQIQKLIDWETKDPIMKEAQTVDDSSKAHFWHFHIKKLTEICYE